MRVRALDATGDWQFGKGANDYKKDRFALTQLIQTRLKSFLYDCFFASNEGIDWFNILGEKDQAKINLDVSTVLLNTVNVTGINQLDITLDESGSLSIQYDVQSTFSASLQGEFTYDVGTLG